MANPSHRFDGPDSLSSLRVAAVVGMAGAIALVVYAFTIHPILGVSGILVSPGIPLGLTVLTDRFRQT